MYPKVFVLDDTQKTITMNQPQVGKLVLELRILMGLTQEQFAAHLGVTLSSISRWERGSA